VLSCIPSRIFCSNFVVLFREQGLELPETRPGRAAKEPQKKRKELNISQLPLLDQAPTRPARVKEDFKSTRTTYGLLD
jgi:hypothetical protein